MRKLLGVASLLAATVIAALLLFVRAPQPDPLTPSSAQAREAGALEPLDEGPDEIESRPVVAEVDDAHGEREPVAAPAGVSPKRADASISGRLRFDSRPVRRAYADLRRHPIAGVGDVAQYDLSESEGKWRGVRSDTWGRFSFERVVPGTYELFLSTEYGDRRRMAPIVVAAAQQLDLGDLAFDSRASISGDVLLPRGLESANIGVLIQADGRSWVGYTGGQARFSVSDLSPGHYTVGILEDNRIFVKAPSLEIELSPGEQREVCIDLRDRIGALLRVDVRLNSERAGRLTCEVMAGATGGIQASRSSEPVRLAEFQLDGPASALLPPATSATLILRSETGVLLHNEGIGALASAMVIEREVDLDVGELTLAMPLDVPADDRELASLCVRSTVDGVAVFTADYDFDDAVAEFMTQDEELGAFSVGSYEIVARFEPRFDSPSWPAHVEWTATALIRRGETTRAVLRKR